MKRFVEQIFAWFRFQWIKLTYEGCLIRTTQAGADKGKIFIVLAGKKHHVMSADLLARFGGWRAVKDISLSNVEMFQTSSPIV